MSDLPSRELAGVVLTETEVKEIVEAWRSGELKTEAEWLEVLNYEMVSAWLATLTPNEGRGVTTSLHLGGQR